MTNSFSESCSLNGDKTNVLSISLDTKAVPRSLITEFFLTVSCVCGTPDVEVKRCGSRLRHDRSLLCGELFSSSKFATWVSSDTDTVDSLLEQLPVFSSFLLTLIEVIVDVGCDIDLLALEGDARTKLLTTDIGLEADPELEFSPNLPKLAEVTWSEIFGEDTLVVGPGGGGTV